MSAGQVLCSLNKRAEVRSMTLIVQLRFQQLPLSLTLLYPTRFESRSGDAGSSLSASAYVPNFHSGAILWVSPAVIIMWTDSVIVLLHTGTLLVSDVNL